jgi:hypothetical protein
MYIPYGCLLLSIYKRHVVQTGSKDENAAERQKGLKWIMELSSIITHRYNNAPYFVQSKSLSLRG